MKQALAVLIVAVNVCRVRGWRATKLRHLVRVMLLGIGGFIGVSAAQLAPPTAAPATAAAPAAIPTACTLPLSASNMQGVANFIWAGCHVLLSWPHDVAPRMSGPSPLATKSVHGYVLNYYSPLGLRVAQGWAAAKHDSGRCGDLEADVQRHQWRAGRSDRMGIDGETEKRVV